MVKKSTKPVMKLTGAPFEGEGAQKLNRRKRRAAAGRLRRSNAAADPLVAVLRTRRGLLGLLGGALVFIALMYGIFLVRT